MNSKDFKRGVYVKCVSDKLYNVTKGNIYEITDDYYFSKSGDLYEIVGAYIIDDKGYPTLNKIYEIQYKTKKKIIFKLKYLYIPKIEWVITNEIENQEINFILATDIEINTKKYNI